MSITTVLETIQSWPVSAAVRGDIPGTEWLFPIIETLHVMAFTLVVGSIAMLDLRLLGLVSRTTPVSRLTAEVLPWTWGSFCVAVVFGTLLFISKADSYAWNLPFQLKFICMGLAAINMLVFHFGAYRNVHHWDATELPLGAKIAGGLSLFFWVGVVFFGRWIGFTA